MEHNITLPVYLIYRRLNSNGLKNTLKQFEGKEEFRLHIIEETPHNNIKLWKILQKCAKEGMDNNYEFIIICEDDHIFTNHYNNKTFINNVIEARSQGCNILCGGIGAFNYAVPITKNRYWIDHFLFSSFMVIYKKSFNLILAERGNNNFVTDKIISDMTSHKMVLYPFISMKYYYSTKLTELQCQTIMRFIDTGSKLKIYQSAFEKYCDDTFLF